MSVEKIQYQINLLVVNYICTALFPVNLNKNPKHAHQTEIIKYIYLKSIFFFILSSLDCLADQLYFKPNFSLTCMCKTTGHPNTIPDKLVAPSKFD